MKKLKKEVKEDFIKKTEQSFAFNTNELPFEEKKKKSHIGLIISLTAVTALVVFTIPLAASFLNTKSSYKTTRKYYSPEQIKYIEEATFKPLNEIEYPSSRGDASPSTEYVEMLNDISLNIYQKIMRQENMIFSPYLLFSNLIIMESLTTDEDSINAFNDFFGSEQDYLNDYLKNFRQNFFLNEFGSMKLYTSAFFNYVLPLNDDVIPHLTKMYCEAYQADFFNDNDVNKILKWVDQKINTKNFITKDDLNIDEHSMILFMQAMYYNQRWQKKYSSSNTIKDTFYCSIDDEVDVDFMNHEYYGKVYLYDDYLTVFDNYYNGYTIKYIVPTNDDNIHEIVDKNHINIFKEDESKIIENVIIDLYVPKFEVTSNIDFTDVLIDCGLEPLFKGHPFDNLYADLKGYTSVSLKYIKQKNKITFNEDGTEVKTLTFSMMAGNSSPAPYEVSTIRLNKPFIYIIYDQNQIPLYVGHMDNPSK